MYCMSALVRLGGGGGVKGAATEGSPIYASVVGECVGGGWGWVYACVCVGGGGGRGGVYVCMFNDF